MHGVLKGTWKDEISGQVSLVQVLLIHVLCLRFETTNLQIYGVNLYFQVVPELTVWKRETQKFALKKLVDVGLLHYAPC